MSLQSEMIREAELDERNQRRLATYRLKRAAYDYHRVTGQKPRIQLQGGRRHGQRPHR